MASTRPTIVATPEPALRLDPQLEELSCFAERCERLIALSSDRIAKSQESLLQARALLRQVEEQLG